MRYLVAAGLLALGLGLYWPKYYSSLKQEGVLATIISSKGTNEWVSRRSLKSLSPQKSNQIKMNESLATGTDGEMVLRFKKGAEIRLLPSSFITLTRKANATLLALRRGDIEVIREGESSSVMVSHKGQDKSLQEFLTKTEPDLLLIDPQSLDTIKTVTTNTTPTTLVTSSDLSNSYNANSVGSSTNPTTVTIASPDPATPASDSPLSLSKGLLTPVTEQDVKDFQTQVRAMISDRVSRQKNHFYRCYTTLIQKKSSKKLDPNKLEGVVELHFTVNSYGKVEDSLITQSEIKDKSFQSCLLQVIKRTDFQPFRGPSISTLLPFQFDKNLQ